MEYKVSTYRLFSAVFKMAQMLKEKRKTTKLCFDLRPDHITNEDYVKIVWDTIGDGDFERYQKMLDETTQLSVVEFQAPDSTMYTHDSRILDGIPEGTIPAYDYMWHQSLLEYCFFNFHMMFPTCVEYNAWDMFAGGRKPERIYRFKCARVQPPKPISVDRDINANYSGLHISRMVSSLQTVMKEHGLIENDLSTMHEGFGVCKDWNAFHRSHPGFLVRFIYAIDKTTNHLREYGEELFSRMADCHSDHVKEEWKYDPENGKYYFSFDSDTTDQMKAFGIPLPIIEKACMFDNLNMGSIEGLKEVPNTRYCKMLLDWFTPENKSFFIYNRDLNSPRKVLWMPNRVMPFLRGKKLKQTIMSPAKMGHYFDFGKVYEMTTHGSGFRVPIIAARNKYGVSEQYDDSQTQWAMKYRRAFIMNSSYDGDQKFVKTTWFKLKEWDALKKMQDDIQSWCSMYKVRYGTSLYPNDTDNYYLRLLAFFRTFTEVKRWLTHTYNQRKDTYLEEHHKYIRMFGPQRPEVLYPKDPLDLIPHTLSTVIHDAGQYDFDIKTHSPYKHGTFWPSFINRYPKAIKHVGTIHKYEDEYATPPSSYDEFVERVLVLRYSDIEFDVNDPVIKECFKYASEYELSSDVFENLLNHMKEVPTKIFSYLPDVNITVGKYTLRKLNPTSPVVLIAGMPTGCCQAIGRVAEQCVLHSKYSAFSDTYYIHPKGNPETVLCVSWTTLCTSGMVMLDSIESKNFREEYVRLFDLFAQELVKQPHIRFVSASSTSYGITARVTGTMKEVESKDVEGKTIKAPLAGGAGMDCNKSGNDTQYRVLDGYRSYSDYNGTSFRIATKYADGENTFLTNIEDFPKFYVHSLYGDEVFLRRCKPSILPMHTPQEQEELKLHNAEEGRLEPEWIKVRTKHSLAHVVTIVSSDGDEIQESVYREMDSFHNTLLHQSKIETSIEWKDHAVICKVCEAASSFEDGCCSHCGYDPAKVVY